MSDRDQRIENCISLFLTAVRDQGMQMSADLRVSEESAALLIGKEPGSLKNMRIEGKAPPHYRAGVGGGRISYRLPDLAAWLEDRLEDFSGERHPTSLNVMD